jgi:hypothetical protein
MTVSANKHSRPVHLVSRWRTRACLLLVFASFCVFGTPVYAVIVGTVMDTTVNPADYEPAEGFEDWDQGDPGWNNVTQTGSNFVYLGNNWVLTARHIAAGTAHFSTGSFTRISSQNFTISNPPSSLANGVSLTSQTDLRLFRISGTPNLPALTIASESPPAAGETGSQMVFIGNGRTRFASESHWSMNLSNPPSNWGTAEVPTGGNVHGYKASSTRTKRWGTNRLEDPSSDEFDNDTFDEILSNTTAVLPLTTSDTITRDVISMVTVFDQQSASSALPWESQAVSGDSGGAVFYNQGTPEDPDWVLSGIVNATLVYGQQPRTYAVYGNGTTFADLSYYNQPYRNSICDYMKTCGSYSIMGDVNIDGAVTGDGTGLATVDDVTAFIAGWGFNNLAGDGNYDSWTKGDLNLDGQTDVADFRMLRGALNGPIGSGAMSALFGAVPEPSSVVLAMFAAACFAFSARRRAGH